MLIPDFDEFERQNARGFAVSRIKRNRTVMIESGFRDADAMQLAANDFSHVFSNSVCGTSAGLAPDRGRAKAHLLRTFFRKARIGSRANAILRHALPTAPALI